MNSALRRTVVAAGTAALALGMGTSTALGAEDPDFTVTFPAGLACAGFDLRVEGWVGNQQFREFTDRDGNVRSISAGTGSALTFTNMSNDATVSFRSNGSTTHKTFGSDGTTTNRMTGHNVLFMYPTDVPAGPSTTLYVGQVVFTADSDQNYTLQSARGTSTDICAALAD